MASVRIENEVAAVSEWEPECCCAMVALGPLFDLEDRLDLDRCAGRELGEAEGAAGMEAVASPAEDFVQQVVVRGCCAGAGQNASLAAEA